MIKIILVVTPALLLLTMCGNSSVGQLMESYLWQKRVLIVLAPRIDDSTLAEQRALLKEHVKGLVERDVIVWDIVHRERVALNGRHMVQMGTPPFYEHYAADPADFTLILLGKDGEEKLRSHKLVAPQKLFELIDTMPMRQRELAR